MFYYWYIEKLMKNFIAKSNLESLGVSIKWEPFHRVPMSYNYKEGVIRFNPSKVEQYHRERPYFTPDETIILMFCHELGHHLHFLNEQQDYIRLKEGKLDKAIKEDKLYFEEKAWEYGRTICPSEWLEKFDLLNQLNLLRYQDVDAFSKFSLKKQIEWYFSLPISASLEGNKTNLSKRMKWKIGYGEKKDEALTKLCKLLQETKESSVDWFYNEQNYILVKNQEKARLIVMPSLQEIGDVYEISI